MENQLGAVLEEVYQVIEKRKKEMPEGSYTTYLFDQGIDKILKKVGEENAEVIIAAKNDAADEIRYEVSDLLYHLLVMLVYHDIPLNEIAQELKGRR